MSKKQRKDMYQEITNKVIEALEKGTIPWEKPWQGTGGLRGLPRSVSTGKTYSGVNLWLLDTAYSNPWWLTFKQAKSLGGCVRKGECGTQIVFYKFVEVKNADTGDVENTFPILKSFTVFNVDQCDIPQEALDNLDARLDKLCGKEVVRNDNEIIDNAQSLMDTYLERENIELLTGGNRAFYRPSSDRITMPKLTDFRDSNSYYATRYHEAVHSTGHKSRLAREDLAKVEAKGDESYSREELTAELGASFLCGVTGIVNKGLTDNRDAYIASWLEALKNDKRAVVVAGGRATKAAEFILGDDFQNESDAE